MFVYLGTLVVCEDGGRGHLPPWLLPVGSFPRWFMSHFSPVTLTRGTAVPREILERVLPHLGGGGR